jgi:hypothetical protein
MKYRVRLWFGHDDDYVDQAYFQLWVKAESPEDALKEARKMIPLSNLIPERLRQSEVYEERFS